MIVSPSYLPAEDDPLGRDDALAPIRAVRAAWPARSAALRTLHETLPALQGADAAILRMSDGEWAEYAVLVEAHAAPDAAVDDVIYQATLDTLRSEAFWIDVVLVALPAIDAQRYFVEQLVRHRYVRRRAFLPTDADAWVPCDVQDAATLWAPEGARPLLHAARPTMRVMRGVTPPFALPFVELHRYLDDPFVMRVLPPAEPLTPDDDLSIVNDYDPAYIDLLLTPLSPELAAGAPALRNVYLPPLLAHESLLHNQPLALPASEPTLRAAAAYVGKLLPTASAAYRAWCDDADPAEARFMLRRAYAFLHLAS